MLKYLCTVPFIEIQEALATAKALSLEEAATSAEKASSRPCPESLIRLTETRVCVCVRPTS